MWCDGALRGPGRARVLSLRIWLQAQGSALPSQPLHTPLGSSAPTNGLLFELNSFKKTVLLARTLLSPLTFYAFSAICKISLQGAVW